MTVALKSLYRPVDGVVAGGVVTYDAWQSAVAEGDWQARTLERWDSPNFNMQGQRLQGVTADPDDGSVNFTSGRLTPQFQPVGSVLDFEFQFSGDKFDVVMTDPGGTYDCQIYIAEDSGPLRKIKDLPLSSTVRGGTGNKVYRRVRLADRRERRIRIILPLTIFHGIIREKRDVIAKSPDRPLMIVTGDSYVESLSAQNVGSARTFHTFGVVDALVEATGFAVARLGQGGTGWFNNAAGQVVGRDDAGPYYSSTFLSAHRAYAMQPHLGSTAKPVVLVINGTINDGELSGQGTGVASASNMQTRVTEGLDFVRTEDPEVGVVLVSPEPYNNHMTASPASPHMINRQGQQAAVAAHPSAIGYVDACDPMKPFYSGLGYESNPVDSSQAAGTGGDQIHGNWSGYHHYGKRIAASMGEFQVDSDRAVRAA